VKPRALDLFCGAGGATRGLQLAGFHVTGVDIAEQPNYCGDAFIRADWARSGLSFVGFDLVWASPPCQSFTAYRRKAPEKIGATYPNLIPNVRTALQLTPVPHYIIENVEGAPLESPVTLCGSMFGLDVRRHRLFECSFPVLAPECRHDLQRGDYPQATNRANRRKTVEVGVWRIQLETQKRAMGVDWDVTLEELSEAIPPAYSEFLGRAALAHIKQRAA
jgi:DNA (cytosine-5)-methyltransferase 1